jgi:hypothetical protein
LTSTSTTTSGNVCEPPYSCQFVQSQYRCRMPA